MVFGFQATHLCAEVEVAEEDRRLGASDHQDDEDDEEETKHVIRLIGPKGVENEEELDEDAAEGEDTSHDDARSWTSVNALVRHLTRDLIRPHWMFDRLIFTISS